MEQKKNKSQEVNSCSFCRAETAVSRAYLHALNKPKVGDGFAFIYYCAECGLREEILDKRMCGVVGGEHKHRFQFSHQQIEARGNQAIYMTIYYVICPECGELREQTIIPRLESE